MYCMDAATDTDLYRCKTITQAVPMQADEQCKMIKAESQTADMVICGSGGGLLGSATSVTVTVLVLVLL